MAANNDNHRTWTPGAVRELGLTTDLPTAAQIIGIGRSLAYDLAKTASSLSGSSASVAECSFQCRTCCAMSAPPPRTTRTGTATKPRATSEGRVHFVEPAAIKPSCGSNAKGRVIAYGSDPSGSVTYGADLGPNPCRSRERTGPCRRMRRTSHKASPRQNRPVSGARWQQIRNN
jgi:hypothetical protein